ncbi:MAG: hypothetical protein J6A60_06200, partial [Clostridia bacterium]|nr:hypothetical protein [Clostridia bacterium]
MKKLSFKIITTVWITLLIAVVCAVSVTALMLISRKTADDKLRQTLVAAVQSNSDEMEFSNGIFEVENDFVYYSDGVYCDLFSEDGGYISGETPHTLIEAPSDLNKVVKKTIDGKEYYVYSELLEFTKFEYEIDIRSGKVISYEADVTPVNELRPVPYSETNFQNGISTNEAIDIALNHAGIKKNEATVIGVQIPVYSDREVFKIEFTADSSSCQKIYIRAICQAEDAVTVFSSIGRSAVYILPFFVIIAAVGAYIISK